MIGICVGYNGITEDCDSLSTYYDVRGIIESFIREVYSNYFKRCAGGYQVNKLWNRIFHTKGQEWELQKSLYSTFYLKTENNSCESAKDTGISTPKI